MFLEEVIFKFQVQYHTFSGNENIQISKSFITQSKCMIFQWSKKFLEVYDLFLLALQKVT